MRFEAQSANTWDRLKTKAGEFFEPFLDYLTDGMERTNRLAEAQGFLGASMSQVYQQSQGAAQIFRLTNGELVTAEQLLRLYEQAQRGANFELERAARLHGMLWPEIESTSRAALSAADAMDRLKSVNTNLSGAIESQLEKARLWAAGIDSLEDAMTGLVAQLMNGDISLFQFEQRAHGAQVAATLTALAAKTIGDDEAQKQLEAYGLQLGQIKSLLEGISSGKYSAELIIDLIGPGRGFGLDAAIAIAEDKANGWAGQANAQNVAKSVGRSYDGPGPGGAYGGFLRYGGIFGHADGGYLGSKGPLVKVGEQGWEYAQYDPSTGAWEIIPHNKSVQMERDRALGMAGGGYLLDGNQYVTKPGNSSAYGTVGNIAPSAVTRPGRAGGGGQNNQVQVQQAADAAAVAALAATGAASSAAAVGAARAVALQGQQQAERATAAFVAETQRSNKELAAEVARMRKAIEGLPSRYDLKAAIREAVSEIM